MKLNLNTFVQLSRKENINNIILSLSYMPRAFSLTTFVHGITYNVWACVEGMLAIIKKTEMRGDSITHSNFEHQQIS